MMPLDPLIVPPQASSAVKTNKNTLQSNFCDKAN